MTKKKKKLDISVLYEKPKVKSKKTKNKIKNNKDSSYDANLYGSLPDDGRPDSCARQLSSTW